MLELIPFGGMPYLALIPGVEVGVGLSVPDFVVSPVKSLTFGKSGCEVGWGEMREVWEEGMG